jgi:hypothetical protein
MRWALTLARMGLRVFCLLAPAFSIAFVLPASLMATFVAGAITPAGLHATPPSGGESAVGAAVAALRMGGNEWVFTPLEQAPPKPTPGIWLWP